MGIVFSFWMGWTLSPERQRRGMWRKKQDNNSVSVFDENNQDQDTSHLEKKIKITVSRVTLAFFFLVLVLVFLVEH